MLKTRFGFRDEDITMLTDDQNSPAAWPTRGNMLAQMQRLVADARPGDSLVFHYSGSPASPGIRVALKMAIKFLLAAQPQSSRPFDAVRGAVALCKGHANDVALLSASLGCGLKCMLGVHSPGHGSQSTDWSGDEDDGYNETL